MKRVIVINKKYRDADREQFSTQEYNLVLPEDSSIIDLPHQVGNVLINNDKIIFKVISWCMFPVIWAGDIIKIEPVSSEALEIGDIVVYKLAGRAYAHRLVKRYKQGRRLYIVTSDQKGYKNNQFSSNGGITADNILGKVVEVKRDRLCFRPDEIKLSSGSLMLGRLKLWIWTLAYKVKRYIAKIFVKLQGIKLYRCFFRRLIRSKILFFVGSPLIKGRKEINNFCFYQKFDDFSKKNIDVRELYNLSARINNRPVGNISLILERMNNYRVCTLSNFVVRLPYRGGGIGYQLVEKAVYLCRKIGVDEIRLVLSGKDKIAISLVKKLGFEVRKAA